jgi:DNA-binding NarL/FixJ family response regulator
MSLKNSPDPRDAQRRGGLLFELTHVESVSAAKKYLTTHSVDIVLPNLGLTDPYGLDVVRGMRAAAPYVSIVLLASADDEQIAVEAIQEGAQDYLIKGQIEPRELMRALLNAAERKIIEEIRFIEKELAQVTLDCVGATRTLEKELTPSRPTRFSACH